MRHQRSHHSRSAPLWCGGVAVALLCAGPATTQAEPANGAATTSPAAWAGGTAAPATAAGSGPLPYWQAPALPSAVIQGGTIPPNWTPQPVPYQGIGPDGRPLTVYYSPTYVFTYQVGPPVLAAATAPAAAQVNRRQAAAQPVPVQGWNYQTQGAAPPTYALPPATVARYQPVPYQYPPGSPALNGTPIVPPQGTAPAAAAASPAPWVAGQQQPAPSQWGASQEAPVMAPAPQQGQRGSAFAAPAAMAGTAAAVGAAAAQQSAPPPTALPPTATFPAAADAGTPVQPVSSQPSAPPASAAGRSGSPRLWRVVGVNDGDTLTCLDESNQQQKVRLADIDAPELSQDFGKVSREALASMVFGKTVEVVDNGKDRYGRWIGRLSVNGIDVNRQMVATGNAWHYEAYSRDDSLGPLQTQAQAQRIGLWAQPSPQPPWEYRANAAKTASST